MKALKLFVEKELKNKPDFLESLLKSTDDVNQEAAKTGFLKQLQASLPFTWSEEMVQAWLYDEANKYHAFNDANQSGILYNTQQHTTFNMCAVFETRNMTCVELCVSCVHIKKICV